MKVEMSEHFNQVYLNFDIPLRQAVARFVAHVEAHGLKGLHGRNKSSVLDNPHSKKEYADSKFAQKYCLWHYHLGVPCYVQQPNGDYTSQYILHYCRYDHAIVLVDISQHPPFQLPTGDVMP